MSPASAQVVQIRLEEPRSPVRIEERHRHALLVVTCDRTVLGEVLVPASGELTPEAQDGAIESSLGDRLWEERLKRQFTRSTRRPRVRGRA